jgi:hypothetical protein
LILIVVFRTDSQQIPIIQSFILHNMKYSKNAFVQFHLNISRFFIEPSIFTIHFFVLFQLILNLIKLSKNCWNYKKRLQFLYIFIIILKKILQFFSIIINIFNPWCEYIFTFNFFFLAFRRILDATKFTSFRQFRNQSLIFEWKICLIKQTWNILFIASFVKIYYLKAENLLNLLVDWVDGGYYMNWFYDSEYDWIETWRVEFSILN